MVQLVAEYFIPEQVILSVKVLVSGVLQLLSALRRQGAIVKRNPRPSSIIAATPGSGTVLTLNAVIL